MHFTTEACVDHMLTLGFRTKESGMEAALIHFSFSLYLFLKIKSSRERGKHGNQF